MSDFPPIDVRANTAGFARDVAAMRAELDSGLGAGAAKAGAMIETSLARAIRSGKFGFDDLRRTALTAMNDIAGAALKAGVGALVGGGGGGGGGLASLATTALSALVGLPGRATGGPVSPQRPYLVGERGPEVFVPTTSGSVIAASAPAPPREVRVAITVNAPGSAAPALLERSSRQVARAVRAALRED